MSTKDVVKPKAKKSHKPRKDSGSLVLGTDISEEHTTLDIDQLSVPKKSRRHQLEVDVTEVGLEAPKSVETKRKLKDRRGKIGENINGVDELIVKKRKKEGEAASNAQDLTVEESAKKSKNGRVHDTFIENGGLGNSEKKKRKDRAHLGDDEPMKKKRKTSNTDFPSPDEDTTLTDQARKALIYAYSQFDDPKNWKFNKARQNWLIRNVFSDQTIPELHMPLLIHYLSNIKGGIRENLIKTCQSIHSPAPTTPADPSSQLHATNARAPHTDIISSKQSRACTILEILSPEA